MKDSPSILLVEDNEDDVILVLRALRKAGVSAPVEVMRDGEEAIRHLNGIDAGTLPTLVLLDLKLPRRNGHEVLEWIRAHPRLAMLPVVILTTSAEQIDVRRAYELGANSYLRKPGNPQETIDLLRSIGLYWLTFNVRPPRLQEAQ